MNSNSHVSSSLSNTTVTSMNFNKKKSTLSFGFTTAGGNSISISDEALSKAEALFADDFNETDTDRQDFRVEEPITESEMQIPNIALQIKGGPHVNVTKEVSSSKNTPTGFKSAANKPIKVSDKALIKATQLFANELEEANACKQPATVTKLVDENEMLLPNIGFHMASGRPVNISEEALLKANTLLSEDTVEETTNNESSFGFRTAGGSSINVSEKALLNARKLLADELEETDTTKDICVIEEGNTPEIESLLQAKTSLLKKISILKAKALCSEETPKNTEIGTVVSETLQKRKIRDLEEDSPMCKPVKSTQFKKLRFSNEFQNTEATRKNLIQNGGKAIQTVATGMSSCSYEFPDSHYPVRASNESNKTNCSISHEIAASTVALLADEKDIANSEQYSSPTSSKQTEDDPDFPSSPVIGRPFVPRKRKNTGSRKKNINSKDNKEEKSSVGDITKKCRQEDKQPIKAEQSVVEEKQTEVSTTNEFGDSQLMIDFIIESANTIEKRLEAAAEQDKQIEMKRICKPKPTISKLYFHKKSNCHNRISWKNISKGNKPLQMTYDQLIEQRLPPELLDITANSALEYRFRCADIYGQDIVQSNVEGIQMEDNACVILDENGYIGISEIKRSFLASPGVDPNLTPEGWVENHYKWIVWKLASMDRMKLGCITLPRALTPAGVMAQLKYRYDREIDRSQRPALRKILEKDDVASKRMILCVASIVEQRDSTAIDKNRKMILTDGWYSIPADIDQAMIKNIISGKIKEGTKLITYGAELLHCDQGCSPLETPGNVCLKLHTNSTRRARWDTKLGYVTPPGPFRVKLDSVSSNGGLIGKIVVLITRVYPILYHEKTSTGESIFRNTRCEEKANIAYENDCRLKMETFYAKAEKNFFDGRRSSSLGASDDPAGMGNRMREEEFRRKLESKLHEELPPPRQVSQLLKIRIVENETSVILSIWSPSEEVRDFLKEGNCVSISNVTAAGRRGSELQFTAGRNAVFKPVATSNVKYPHRIYTPLYDVVKPTFSPEYGEFDTVGIVIGTCETPHGMKNFEAVHLAYPVPDSTQSAYLSILFWHGTATHGYAEILTVGSCVACNNLEWRRAASRSIPMAYCTDRSVFTRNPRQSHFQQPFQDLKSLITDIPAYVIKCAEEISKEMQKKSPSRTSNQNDILHPDRHIANYMQEPSPRDMRNNCYAAKSAAIQKRLEKLQYYGEPSKLSPIVLKNSSKRVSLDFKSPVDSIRSQPMKSRTSLTLKFSENPS